MHRWALFWGLSLGALATRLLIARMTDLPAALGMPTLGAESLATAVALGGALMLVAAGALVGRRRRRSAHLAAPPADPVPDPLLEGRLVEAHRLLAERNEQLAFVRDVLQSRTAELDRLREEQSAMPRRLDEARTAGLQAERARFQVEWSRLSEALMRSTRETSQSAQELVDAMHEVTRRTREADDLRAEAAHLRAELERLRSLDREAEPGARPLADI